MISTAKRCKVALFVYKNILKTNLKTKNVVNLSKKHLKKIFFLARYLGKNAV